MPVSTIPGVSSVYPSLFNSIGPSQRKLKPSHFTWEILKSVSRLLWWGIASTCELEPGPRNSPFICMKLTETLQGSRLHFARVLTKRPKSVCLPLKLCFTMISKIYLCSNFCFFLYIVCLFLYPCALLYSDVIWSISVSVYQIVIRRRFSIVFTITNLLNWKQ